VFGMDLDKVPKMSHFYYFQIELTTKGLFYINAVYIYIYISYY